jgi:RHS repeat-associated protein
MKLPHWGRVILVLVLALCSQLSWALKCDADNDGDIDRDDLALIQKATLARTPVSGADDPRDADNNGVIDSIDGRICALRCTRASCATNSAPLANAGPDQTVRVTELVTLNGRASSDPDGNPITYAWSLTNRPAGSTAVLAGANTVAPTFTVDKPGSYVASLVVNDGKLNSAPDTVTITTENSRPVANAGPDQTAPVGTLVTLDGSRSSDVDGDALSYAWRFVTVPAGSTAALNNAAAVNPGFTIDRAGDYTIELLVSDGRLTSAADLIVVSTSNSAPVANAGPDQTVLVGDTVTLSGAASSDVDGNALAYAWSLLSRPAGSSAALQNPTAVMPTFVADRAGSYVIQLIVNDGTLNSAPDSVVVNTGNTPPVARAGNDQTVPLGAVVQLDGSQSSDVDGNALSFAWSLTTRPAGSAAVLSNPSAVAPSFTADAPGSYVAQLIVNDGVVNSAPSTVTITTQNAAPTARAGQDQTVALGAVVQLDGSASSDPEGAPLTFAWSLVSKPAGSTAALTGAATATPSFTADKAGSYVAQLIVSDGTLASAPASVTISTINSRPVADAGAAQNANTGATVQLDGSGSRDADGDALTYAWSLTTRPAGSAAVLNNPALPNPSFVADVAGLYVAQLIVSDGRLASAPATVSITVTTPNRAPIAVAVGAPPSAPAGSTFNLDGTGSSDPDNDPLTYSWALTVRPAGSAATIANANAANASFVADLRGLYRAELTVSDGRASHSATADVTATNRAPAANAGTAQTVTVGSQVTLDGSGSSDPDGDALTFQWVLTVRPNGSAAALTGANTARPTFTPDVAGLYTATLTVNDGSAASAPSSVNITANPAQANTAPTANADRYTTGEGVALDVAAAGGVLANDRDAENDPLTAELVTPPVAGGTLTLQANGALRYVPATGFAGTDRFTYRARDASLASAPATVEIVITPAPDVLPLDLDLTITPTVVSAGGSVRITVTPRGGRPPISRALVVDGAPVALDATGSATLAGVTAGPHRVQATVTDALGSVTKEASFSGEVSGDTGAPTAAITSPVNSAELFGAVNVVGTANDPNFVEYRLLFAPAGSPQFTEFDRGTSPVVNGVLGQFDITTLSNGLFDIVLEVRDANGRTSTAKVTVEVIGDQKVGNFRLTFEDLNVDAARIPITVTRTYDSARRNERLDFGYGWSVDYQNVSIRANQVLGLNWTLSSSGGIIRTWCLRPNGRHTVSVTLPDGKVERFDMTVSPECTQVVPPQNVTAVFTARAGTRSTLVQDSGVLFVNGDQLLDLGSVEPYNPTVFTLTTEDRYVYTLDRNFGIRSVRDPSGYTLTYSSNGITHSGGQSVVFQRDGQGRITRITDPAGRSLQYSYNANGDLATVVDRGGETARMRYNRSHGLVDFTDPRGVLLARNVYDDDGRLIEQYDAAGNRIAITSDTAAQRQTVRDRRGFTTTFEYDVSGNVTRSIDPLGGVTAYGYDARGNETSVSDPLGRVTTRSFSAEDRLLSEADPLGNVTSYVYSASGQPSVITDPLGRRTEIAYAASGNPTQIRDTAGAATQLAYDAAGNLTQVTDTAGAITRYVYDGAGRRLSEQDAAGGITRFTYDANGKETSRTRQRTSQGVLVDMTTSFTHDANGNLTSETDPDGRVETTAYNALGKVATRTDKLGRVTRYEYDSRGLLEATVFPDGTRESIEYDANGNETARVDRAGRRSLLAYDALNRLTDVTLPDGSTQRTLHDAAGQVVEEIDGRGNRTTYQYDAAGRRTRTTNALGQSTVSTYDAVGNLTSVTDARGNTTAYQYDAANRRTRTTFPDGTFVAVSYDATGRKTSETDQAGRVTTFAHDAVGRLITVTDPLGGITRYTYDEVGNRLTQQDALGRITRWEYDNHGRPTRRTLPGGQSESFTYDARGNRLTHTDFNGGATSFTYDSMDRPILRRLPDGSQVATTYTPTGRPATVTDSRGATVHTYDVLDRLVQVSNPDGSVLRYAYDAAGNRIELIVQQGARPSRTTRYAYDALNRPATVTDPEGDITAYSYDANGNRASMLLPNGVRADYAYDALNRLTLLEHRRVSDNAVLARFAYTLAANGQRVRAVETVNGATRTVDYAYDAYQRLVREQITDPALGNRDAAYVYDAVGNRLRMTVGAAQTDYVYDANDRLLSESAGGTTTTHRYDANGNLLGSSVGINVVASYAWDGANRLISATRGGPVVTYAYDSDGVRVAKTIGGVTSHYVVDKNREFAEVVEERSASGDLIVGYVQGDDLIKQLRGGQTAYYHADGLGSVRALSNTAGTVTDTWHYAAFGAELARTGTTPNEYRFTGEQIDPNTGFYYLRARWMNPEVGRFLSLDSYPGRSGDPASLHKYLYASGDPVNLRDPSGRLSIGFGGFAGAFISLAVRISYPLIVGGGVRAFVGSLLVRSAYALAPTLAAISARQLVSASLIALTATAITLCANSDRCRPSVSIYLAGRQTPQTTQHNFDALFGAGSNGSPISPFFIKGPRNPVKYNLIGTPHPPCTPPRSGSCDEYPYATAIQGGEANWAAGNVSLRVIAGEDSTQGNQLSQFYGACGVSIGTPFVAFGLPGVPAGYLCSNGRAKLF